MGDLDIKMALWFHNQQMTKGNVTSFFKESTLNPMHDMLGFHTAKQWLDRLDAIPHGISIKNWKKSNVGIPMGTTQKHMKHIYYHYQGVKEVIQFLLGHHPFEKNLTYAPIQLYSATGS